MMPDSIRCIIDGLREYEQILIYGAGGVAEDFLLLLEPYIDVINLGIIVTRSDGERTLRGIRVNNLSDYTDEAEMCFVIIAAMPRLIESMRTNLIENGFMNYTDVYEIFESIYREIWNEEIANDKILFSNYRGLGFGDNGKYIAKKLLDPPGKYDIVWAVSEDKYDFPEGIRTVVYGTYEYYQELGSAHIWVDNRHKSRLSFKRKGQYYIQTWHGGGPLKKIEHDGNGISQSYLDLCDYDSGIIDLMISPTRFNSGLYRTAFHYYGEILECGYPRNDVFFEDSGLGVAVKKSFGISNDCMIVLYAPTFRDYNNMAEKLDLSLVKEAVRTRTQKEVSVMVRMHPDVKNQSIPDNLINATFYSDTQELLAAADMLITDYSSIMWDYSIQRKPVFLFQPDNDGYEEERGYYLTFEKMPFFRARSTNEMCDMIEAYDDDIYREKVDCFLKEYGSFDTGIAADGIRKRIETVCRMGE